MSKVLKGYKAYLETDFSRFDRSISLPALMQIQDVLFRLSSADPLFRQCLTFAYRTSGSSRHGVKYSITGSRCSGDAHTSIGNGFINAVTTYICMRHLHRESWTSIHEGDDGVIATMEPEESLRGLNLMRLMGFDLKCDLYYQLDDVSFCGRHLYETPDSVKSHADVLRSLDKFHTTVSNMKAISLVYAKSLSYNHTDHDTPLIGPLTYAICEVLHKRVSFSQIKRGVQSINRQRWMSDIKATNKARKPNITWQARVSVARRTGLSPSYQKWLESHYMLMIDRDSLLHLPKINSEWLVREDGMVWGDPTAFIR